MNKIVGIVIIGLAMGFLWLVLILNNSKKNLVQVSSLTPTITQTQIEQRIDLKPAMEQIGQIVRGMNKVVVTPTPTTVPILKPTPKPTDDGLPWGVSTQVGNDTWTMKIGEDTTMATQKEILDALNEYRRVHGSQILTWNKKLGNYAQERADYLNGIKSVDEHTGFKNFVENEDGFNKLGFTALGENISYGYRLNGVHFIEWLYAGDKPHNDNQLDNRWNYVGIGVKGLATSLIFGTGKM